MGLSYVCVCFGSNTDVITRHIFFWRMLQGDRWQRSRAGLFFGKFTRSGLEDQIFGIYYIAAVPHTYP